MLQFLGRKVAITPIFDPDKIGSLYVPDIAKQRVDQGIVKYIGPDVVDIKPLDYVIFSGYSGTQLKVDGEGMLIVLNEDFIVARIDDIPFTTVDGLYFRDRDRGYFGATYEEAINVISAGITAADWHNRFNVKVPNPIFEGTNKE